MPMRPDTRWVWTSPNGRITHTYKPTYGHVYNLYRKRGWTVHYTKLLEKAPS